MEYEKTRKMRRAERAIGKPLELAMPEAYEKCGTIAAAAEELNIPLGTFRCWMRELGISLRRRLDTH